MKYIYILLIIFFTIFQFDFSYGSLLISGDKKLSDNISTETVSGDYSLTTGEISLVKKQTITSSNKAGKGSCQSVRQAIGLIIQGVSTSGVWYVTGIVSCIETDFNNDGNIETVYALNRTYMDYQGYLQYSTVTYITKQPNDKLILSGNLTSRDYSLNEKQIPGTLIQQSIGGKLYYVTNIDIGYTDYYGRVLSFPVLGEVWGNKHVVDTGFNVPNGAFSYDPIMIAYLQTNYNITITHSDAPTRHWDRRRGWSIIHHYTTKVSIGGINVKTTPLYPIPNYPINLYAIPELKSKLLNSGNFNDRGSGLYPTAAAAPSYDYFIKLYSINKQGFHAVTINNKQYFIGSYPTYNVGWSAISGLEVDTYYLHDSNFNIVMTLGDSGQYTFFNSSSLSYPFTIFKSKDLNGYGDVISSKLGHSDWIIMINKGSLNLVDIKNKKIYNIITNVINLLNGWYSTTDYINPSLVYSDSGSILFQEGTSSFRRGSYIGGLILLDQNVTLDSVNNKVLQVQEKKASTYSPGANGWQGIIKDTIYSNGRDLYKREKTTNSSSLTYLGANNGGPHDCIFSTCDSYGMIMRVIGGYTVYDLQYFEWSLYGWRDYRMADTHIFFTFRNSDGAYIGMKRTPGLTRNTWIDQYNGTTDSVFYNGTNLDNTSMIYRTLSTTSLQYKYGPVSRSYFYKRRYVMVANPQTVFQYTPSSNYLYIVN